MKKIFNNFFISALMFCYSASFAGDMISNEQTLVQNVITADSNKQRVTANKNLLSYYMSQKLYEKAAPVCDKLAELKLSKKQKYYVYYSIAVIKNHGIEFEDAIEYCKQAEYLYPKKIDPKILLGEIYKKNVLYELAKDKFKEALTIDSKSVTALINLADIFRIQGNYKAALKYYEYVTVLRENVDADIYLNMAKSAKELGLSDKAEKILEKIYKSNPGAETSILLAALYREQGRFKDAEKKLSALIINEENSDNIEIYSKLATLYIISKDYDKAKKLLTDFKNKNGNVAITDLLLAEVCRLTYDEQSALKLLNEIVEYSDSDYIKTYAKHLISILKKDNFK